MDTTTAKTKATRLLKVGDVFYTGWRRAIVTYVTPVADGEVIEVGYRVEPTGRHPHGYESCLYSDIDKRVKLQPY